MYPNSLLINPDTYAPEHFDPETVRLLRATIDWFESRGKARLASDYHQRVFHQEFLDFAAREKLFATFLTPTAEAGGAPDKRWDTSRISALSEILGFYGLTYWYPWQVTILGLGPVWQSANQSARARAAQALDAGGVGAFGLSEREHGADIYSTDMVLSPDGDGGYTASGSKYYIGNGNCANTVSVFGKIVAEGGPDRYVFFYADADHPAFHLVKNVVASQMFVAEFTLDAYPVREEDILHTGDDAFSAALNTVNVGKFNLCFCGIGMCTHAFYEAITHAHNRILYGHPVTDFPHVRRTFVDAYVRMIGMKLFSDRAIDYFRSAHLGDRRYLLFNPITKMKVTTEAENVLALLADVVAAKSFEADTYLTIARSDVPGLPKLEGTVAVNLALILKFLPAYFFGPAEHEPAPTRNDAADDEFLFAQGPARGLGKVRFHRWRTAYEAKAHLPNVALFLEQADAFADLIREVGPDADQQQDLDFMLALGELFTLIVYGQLICEQAAIVGVSDTEAPVVSDDVLDQVFDVLVRDFSRRAVELHGKTGASTEQQAHALALVRRQAAAGEEFDRVWDEVVGYSGRYEMRG
ncbi:acyl-CoA dehydrogenase family protein [Speluncibacter jeojiensis]|uniref:Acyl-CoA/acyl-ACP dehydrogenase n=1 Tax=Speluncibacter jeojiensis TaxID=2710754 RepID=A0A9X4RJ48_9ACTN|nr:acyl-CoA/acyl-ACP dehydrogenase [Corynebacteriales bacterium D3-21]